MDFITIIVEHAKQEWDVIKRAPIAALLCTAVGWLLCSFFNETRLALSEERQAIAEEKTSVVHERLLICDKALENRIEAIAIANQMQCPSPEVNEGISDLAQKANDCRLKEAVTNAKLAACLSNKNIFLLEQSEPQTTKEFRSWIKGLFSDEGL